MKPETPIFPLAVGTVPPPQSDLPRRRMDQAYRLVLRWRIDGFAPEARWHPEHGVVIVAKRDARPLCYPSTLRPEILYALGVLEGLWRGPLPNGGVR